VKQDKPSLQQNRNPATILFRFPRFREAAEYQTRMIKRLTVCDWVLLIFVALGSCLAVRANPRLPGLFSDHVVLQRGREIPVWGSADAGEKIVVTLGADMREAVAGSDGRWSVRLPARDSGGPFTMQVAGKRTLLVRDVMIGEVWVASGQSNMDFTLARAQNAAAELPKANSPQIRFIKVPLKSALEAQADISSGWQVATPDAARNWSAVAYFFAKRLHSKLNVPVGIIQSTWSGTAAELWTAPDALGLEPDFRPILQRWDDAPERDKELARAPTRFQLQFDDFELLGGGEHGRPLCDFDNGPARTSTGGYWTSAEDTGSEFSLVAPGRGGTGRAALYSGELVAGTQRALSATFTADGSPIDLSRYAGLRFYVRGRGFYKLHFSEPNITDWDDYSTAGFEATADWQPVTILFKDLKQAGWGVKRAFTPHSLTGFSIDVMRTRDGDPLLPPSSLYQGMIAPLTPFAIRGAIWYQGEGNAGRAYQYRKLLPAMINSWRKAWGQGNFPFLIVQLPNYGEGPTPSARSAWAELREAQLLTFKNTPNTGLAVTLGLGEPGNVHPPRKAEVGERLALWALGTTYGEQIVYSGPLFESSRAEQGRIRVSFSNVGSGLAIGGGDRLQGFIIAGTDMKFHPAQAMIEGETVVVSSPLVPHPVAVRYAWADDPEGSLINKEGLPASTFRTDDWPAVTANAR
jgi:sialate O-acetylesterase